MFPVEGEQSQTNGVQDEDGAELRSGREEREEILKMDHGRSQNRNYKISNWTGRGHTGRIGCT
jgi:hypothetical protein